MSTRGECKSCGRTGSLLDGDDGLCDWCAGVRAYRWARLYRAMLAAVPAFCDRCGITTAHDGSGCVNCRLLAGAKKPATPSDVSP